jgi:hypothetical protein
MDAGEISYLWEMVISYHPTTSCPSRGFTITQTTTQTSTYTETTFEKYYTTLTKWITVFEDAMNILSAMPETIAPTVTKSAGDLFLPAHPVASSIQPRTIDKVLNKINSNHVQR